MTGRRSRGLWLLLLEVGAIAAILGGCSLLRWKGHHPDGFLEPGYSGPRALVPETSGPDYSIGRDDEDEEGWFEVRPSSGRAPSAPRFDPRDLPEKHLDTLYYSDLGPDSIDVSSYPEQQQKNYAVYARACYQCHTLARSINAPAASPAFWEFYLLSMRTRTKFALGDAKITKEESKAILDFIEYDSDVRKLGRKEEFNALTERLKASFNLMAEDRIRRLQEQKQPKPEEQDQQEKPEQGENETEKTEGGEEDQTPASGAAPCHR